MHARSDICQATSRMGRLLIAALTVATAQPAIAGHCENGRLVDVFGNVLGFGAFCQSFSGGDTAANKQLDDWRRYGFDKQPGATRPRTVEDLAVAVDANWARNLDRDLRRREELLRRQAALETQLAELEGKIEGLERAEEAFRQHETADYRAEKAWLERQLELLDESRPDPDALAAALAQYERYDLASDSEQNNALRDAALKTLQDLRTQTDTWERNHAAVTAELGALQAPATTMADRTSQKRNDALDEHGRVSLALDRVKQELAELEADIARQGYQLQSGGGTEIRSDMNAPANLPGAGPLTFWSTGNLSRNDESGAARMLTATTAGLMAGVSGEIDANTGWSLGVGYARTATAETSPLGSGTILTNALQARATGYHAADLLTFDASVRFDYSWNHRDQGWFTDDYTMHVLGLGAGVNGALAVASALTFDWRLGYAGTWTFRHASTDSVGRTSTAFGTALHRASAKGRLTYALPDSMSGIYGEATLNAVLADTSVAGRAAAPFSLDLAAGGHVDLGGMDLSFGGSLDEIGRAGVTSWHLDASLTIPF